MAATNLGCTLTYRAAFFVGGFKAKLHKNPSTNCSELFLPSLPKGKLERWTATRFLSDLYLAVALCHHACSNSLKQNQKNKLTHTAWEERLPPRLDFFPMTGVPKCSGFVNGSWSSVWVEQFHHISIIWTSARRLQSPVGKLTSLSAKCLSPFRHRDVRRRVFSSPSSKTETNREVNILEEAIVYRCTG